VRLSLGSFLQTFIFPFQPSIVFLKTHSLYIPVRQNNRQKKKEKVSKKKETERNREAYKFWRLFFCSVISRQNRFPPF